MKESMCECANCGKVMPEDELKEAQDLWQRLAPGDEFPAGECPECGCLAYGVEPSWEKEKQDAPPSLPTVKWIAEKDEVPDAELAVLVYMPNADDEVWLATYEGNGLWSLTGNEDGHPVSTVTHWAHLPEGPK
jgi:hypothetical protein